MKVWRIVTVLLLGLVLAGSVACNPFADDEQETSQQLVEVVRGDLIVSVSGSGNIEVSNEVRLAFGVGGRIDKIYVEEGDNVTDGDALAKLDTDALELALAQAQAALEQAEYNLEKAEEPYSRDDIKSARAAVASADDYLEYVQWMLEDAQWMLDQAEAAEVEGAEAEVKRWTAEVSGAWANFLAAEAQLEAILDAPDEGAVDAAEAQLEAAEQAVVQAQKQLDEATITAPFNGIVASVGADEGDTVLTTTTIIHLIDLTSMELKVDVDEIDVAEVKPGQRAIIEVDALPALQLEGGVTFISSLAEEEAGVVLYEVKIDFAVPEGSGLRVGMSATADIIIDERSNVLLVPIRAVTQDSQGNPVVKVMVNEEIEERPVVIGISDGFDTEIVSGISEGEVVVVEKRAK